LKSKKFDKKFSVIKNLDRNKFLSLLSNSYAIVGNSSCGILEAPSFKMPVINIGTRQNRRPQARNIINSSNSEKDIYLKMKFINQNKKYLKSLKKVQNIFFKPNSSRLILNIIKKLKKNDKIFRKY
jgi:UDP-N-acetylglucosamine 2-epimerase